MIPKVSFSSEKQNKISKKYVLISLFESPPRWMMDLVLKPSENDPFKPHPFISNEFVIDKKNISTCYKTVKIKDYFFSSIWKKEIPTSTGDWTILSNILDNTLIVRGCDMRQDGHPINSMKLEAPSAESISLGGVLANQSETFFPAIGMSGEEAALEKSLIGAFKTPNDEKAISLLEPEQGKGSYIEQLLAPYRTSPFKKTTSSNEEIFLSLLKKHMNVSNSEVETKKTRQTIKKLENLPLDKIISHYNEAEKKYHSLITRSLSEKPLSGVNDQPLPGLILPQKFPLKNASDIKIDDYIGEYKADDVYVGNTDLRSIFKSASIPSLSHQFAMSEVSLMYSLSDVILFNVDPVKNLHFENSYSLENIRTEIIGNEVNIYSIDNKKYNTSKRIEVLNIDGHNVGSYIGILGYSLYFRAVASCLNEFIHYLKTNKINNVNLFDQTLIHMSCEFERKPRGNLSGSDHGWKGHTSTFISGMIDKLQVIGNIHVEADNDGSATWGQSAVIEELGRVINYNDIITSIADALEIPSPVGGQKIFSLVNNKIMPKIKTAKNILS